MTELITVPRWLMRVVESDWRIKFGQQPLGQDGAGGNQIIISRFPKWIGSPVIALSPNDTNAWQAIIARAAGMENALRVPMIERSHSPFDKLERGSLLALGLMSEDMSGYPANEARLTVPATVAAIASASQITVDERQLPSPIPAGHILSYQDWPFRVLWRSRLSSGLTELGVSAPRVAIPNGGQIDVLAYGLFKMISDEGAYPVLKGGANSLTLQLEEWITR